MRDINISGGSPNIVVNEKVQKELFEKRSEAITLKLTPSERAALDQLSAETGLQPSVVARECLMTFLEIRQLSPAMTVLISTLERIMSKKIF